MRSLPDLNNGDILIKPHYIDIVEGSELGKELADVMTQAFYNLVDTPFKNLGEQLECSISVDIENIGKLRQKMNDFSRTHYLGEEVYKDAILELTERIENIVTEDKIGDGNHFRDCVNYAALITQYLDELKYAKRKEDAGRTGNPFKESNTA